MLETIDLEHNVVYHFHNESVWIFLKRELIGYSMCSFFNFFDKLFSCWYMLIPPIYIEIDFHVREEFFYVFKLSVTMSMLKGIEYNSSTKDKYPNSKEIVSTGSTENCESEKWDTEVGKDKKVSFDNVTNAG